MTEMEQSGIEVVEKIPQMEQRQEAWAMTKSELQDKRIAVIGAGGVGGYLAGMLGRVYPHVTLAARGERGKSIREHGLILHSDYHGEICVNPELVADSIGELPPQDYIFLCVKNYSLKQAAAELKNVIDERTVVIPVMNGADVGKRVRELLQIGIVVDSLIYIIAYANTDFSIFQQGDIADIRIGIMDPDEREKKAVEEVSAILAGAGINFEESDDIEREIWRKYMLNCAYNVATAYYDNTIGELRKSRHKSKEYEQLAWESYEVARAKGVHVSRDDVQYIIDRFYYDYKETATSSLQRDIREGRQTELDIFGGYLTEEAHKLGVDVPLSEKMYFGLKEKTAQSKQPQKNLR